MFALTGPVLLVCLRAMTRAVAALRLGPIPSAATLGLWRPRIVLHPEFVASLDDAEREAVLAHERAHARHRDPLRVWVAQILTDLQWPFPGARARFEGWRDALELSRDDEARATADGADLAAAVLAAARRGNALEAVGVTSRSSESLRLRVERLLAPLLPSRPPRRFSLALAFFGLAFVAMLAGGYFGERLVLGLCGT
jgi:beta-lactamase regulating signal transducer with metallopeptidase domain